MCQIPVFNKTGKVICFAVPVKTADILQLPHIVTTEDSSIPYHMLHSGQIVVNLCRERRICRDWRASCRESNSRTQTCARSKRRIGIKQLFKYCAW